MNNRLVAMQTSSLSHAAVSWLDLNGFVEVFQRKCQRVKEAVVSLDQPLPNKVVRQMAIVADRHMPMAGMLPRIVIILHHMAICTSLWVIAQIACSLAVSNGKHTDADKHTKHDRKDHRRRAECSKYFEMASAHGLGTLNWVTTRAFPFEKKLDLMVEVGQFGVVQRCETAFAARGRHV